MKLTSLQKEAVTHLWSLYGNGGFYHTRGNHEFLKAHIYGDVDEVVGCQPNEECKQAFRKVLDGDYSMLTVKARKSLVQAKESESNE